MTETDPQFLARRDEFHRDLMDLIDGYRDILDGAALARLNPDEFDDNHTAAAQDTTLAGWVLITEWSPLQPIQGDVEVGTFLRIMSAPWMTGSYVRGLTAEAFA